MRDSSFGSRPAIRNCCGTLGQGRCAKIDSTGFAPCVLRASGAGRTVGEEAARSTRRQAEAASNGQEYRGGFNTPPQNSIMRAAGQLAMVPFSNNRILIEDRVTEQTERLARGLCKFMQVPRNL